MDILFLTLLSIFLFILAFRDYKYLEVPDVVIALSWVLVLISLDHNAIETMSWTFGVSFLINSYYTAKNKEQQQLLSWGDNLYIPVYTAFAGILPTLLAIFLCFGSATYLKRNMPLVPFLCAIWTLMLVQSFYTTLFLK